MPLIDTLKSWWDSDTKVLARVDLPAAQVDRTADYLPLAARKHYVRVWLAQMFLRKQVSWGQTLFPAVHSMAKFTFGSDSVAVPGVADSSKIGLADDGKGDLVASNFLLTPLIPFAGGVVELSAGLAALKGANNLQGFTKVLGDFSSLLVVPQLSAALKVAEPLAAGMQALFAGSGSHLGFHDAYEAGRSGGYIAVIRAEEAQIDRKRLWVVADRLREGRDAASSVPFDRFDHMLLRLQVIAERDDWESLDFIAGPMAKAADSLGAGRAEEAATFYRAALLAVHSARELTEADRTRAKLKLRDDFEAMRREFAVSGAVGAEVWSFARTMKKALAVDDALARPEPSLDQLLGG